MDVVSLLTSRNQLILSITYITTKIRRLWSRSSLQLIYILILIYIINHNLSYNFLLETRLFQGTVSSLDHFCFIICINDFPSIIFRWYQYILNYEPCMKWKQNVISVFKKLNVWFNVHRWNI